MPLLGFIQFQLIAAVGHGHVTLPASTRNGGSLAKGGDCRNGACFWFSNNVEIPGKPTLPKQFWSVNNNVTEGAPNDLFATSPWRAPGSAPVYGSGCGSAGGGPVAYLNGGYPPSGIKQGMDGLELPTNGQPTVWKRGSQAQVSWAISANHGGGYSYRLCKNIKGKVNEACFQATPLEFASNQSWLVYPDHDVNAPLPSMDEDESIDVVRARRDGDKKCTEVPESQCAPDFFHNCLQCGKSSSYNCTKCCPGCEEVTKSVQGKVYSWCYCGKKPNPGPSPNPPSPPSPPRPFLNPSFTQGTFPAGSSWKRDPVPGCHMCDSLEKCGKPLKPDPRMSQPNPWNDQVDCYAACDGSTSSKLMGYCPEGTANFPEPLPNISGFGKTVWPWSILDLVKVPTHLEPGSYLLSWRWDCEESTQVWQGCSDIILE